MNKGFIPAAGLTKLFNDLEQDMPDVPWAPDVIKYLRAIRKMASNLVTHDVEAKLDKPELIKKKSVFVPATYGKPKKDDIYEIMRRVKNRDKDYIVKDVVWLKDGEWVAMNGQPINDTDVRAWELKEDM